MSDIYRLAAKAKVKLFEAANNGTDLRVLVCHANLLDSLTDSLTRQSSKELNKSNRGEKRSINSKLPP